mmetsp:Transcript_43995/g.84045  ORF Transcript_43995/g.84045 Transcript_43995/m.84045 type:complete len:228 (+) Transcript_43995:1905-2588(+)
MVPMQARLRGGEGGGRDVRQVPDHQPGQGVPHAAGGGDGAGRRWDRQRHVLPLGVGGTGDASRAAAAARILRATQPRGLAHPIHRLAHQINQRAPRRGREQRGKQPRAVHAGVGNHHHPADKQPGADRGRGGGRGDAAGGGARVVLHAQGGAHGEHEPHSVAARAQGQVREVQLHQSGRGQDSAVPADGAGSQLSVACGGGTDPGEWPGWQGVDYTKSARDPTNGSY